MITIRFMDQVQAYEKRAGVPLTEIELAEKIGISTRTLWKLKQGKIGQIETLDRLCAFFGCEPQDLLEYKAG